jgi:hypothetical protein
MVTLSSGVRGPIHYSFKKDPSVDAPFLVKVQIEPDKLEKFCGARPPRSVTLN